jgi:importin subunit beta-1
MMLHHGLVTFRCQVQYIGLLTQELVDANGDPSVRSAAGIAIKNSLTATDSLRKEEKFNKWNSVDVNLRSQIKQAVRLPMAILAKLGLRCTIISCLFLL